MTDLQMLREKRIILVIDNPEKGPMDTMNIAASDLRDARKAAGLTQQEAADLTQTSIDTWQNWEQNRFSIHVATYEMFLLQTGQFQALKPVHKIDTTRLRLKLRSGRVVEIPIKDSALIAAAAS